MFRDGFQAEVAGEGRQAKHRFYQAKTRAKADPGTGGEGEVGKFGGRLGGVRQEALRAEGVWLRLIGFVALHQPERNDDDVAF